MKDKMAQSVNELPVQRFAVGNDLVFVPHFETSLTQEFKNKVYTSGETAYCEQFSDSLLRYASTWAAKEAVYKAFKQLNTSALGWKNIEISREKAGGRPQAILHKHAESLAVSVTISHDGDYAWAIAFIEYAK